MGFIHALARGGLQEIGAIYGYSEAVLDKVQAFHFKGGQKRLDPQTGSERLARFVNASLALIQVLARVAGRARLDDLQRDDRITFNRDLFEMASVPYAGVHSRA